MRQKSKKNTWLKLAIKKKVGVKTCLNGSVKQFWPFALGDAFQASPNRAIPSEPEWLQNTSGFHMSGRWMWH